MQDIQIHILGGKNGLNATYERKNSMMKCHPTNSPEISLTYETRRNKLNRLEFNVIGKYRTENWMTDKVFKRHFKTD
jgi:hypothetical protein